MKTNGTFEQSLRSAARRLAPRLLLDGYRHLKLMRHARRLCELRDRTQDPRAVIEELMRSHFFRPLQKRSEILRLLEMIEALRPANICEVGAAGGGTTFLLSQAAPPDATIITLDLNMTRSRSRAIREFARGSQRIICLSGDSHLEETRRAVREALAGRELDVLYLDGDHRYEGIAADFHSYAPLVRAGGIIVLHDIVPDYRTRYGMETNSYTGGVPRFWSELKRDFRRVSEIVEDAEQDGLGIGILFWEGERASVAPPSHDEEDDGQAVELHDDKVDEPALESTDERSDETSVEVETRFHV